MAATLRKHRPLLLNWLRVKKTVSAGAVEAVNYKAKPAFGRAHGFKCLEAVEIGLDRSLGALPEWKMPHGFC
ncbi:MAG: transposase [SAR324 cluster bacterium]|nr:transposase [SAR324 cluster bacterium]